MLETYIYRERSSARDMYTYIERGAVLETYIYNIERGAVLEIYIYI